MEHTVSRFQGLNGLKEHNSGKTITITLVKLIKKRLQLAHAKRCIYKLLAEE